MANGYQTIVSVIENDHNMQYLQTDLENAFWIQHRGFHPDGRARPSSTVRQARRAVGADLERLGLSRTGAASGWAGSRGSASSRRGTWPTPDATPTGRITIPSRSLTRCGRSSATASSCRTTPTRNGSSATIRVGTARSGEIFDRWKEIGVEDPANRTSPDRAPDRARQGPRTSAGCASRPCCSWRRKLERSGPDRGANASHRVRRPQACPVLGLVRADVPAGARALHRRELLRDLRRLGAVGDRRGPPAGCAATGKPWSRSPT